MTHSSTLKEPLVFITVLVLFFGIALSGMSYTPQNESLKHYNANDIGPAPDFRHFANTQEKKTAFFRYFSDIVNDKNSKLLALRSRVSAIAQSDSLKTDERAWLVEIMAAYGVKLEGKTFADALSELVSRIDEIPRSLVVAQAAMESVWGTSRFAVKGANFFGHWCYQKGCGLVPAQRAENGRHEVRTFDSPAASVDAYFRNINSHRAYAKLRRIRQAARKEDKALDGCALAEGLAHYAEQGLAYVNAIKHLIHSNALEPESSACVTG